MCLMPLKQTIVQIYGFGTRQVGFSISGFSHTQQSLDITQNGVNNNNNNNNDNNKNIQ